MDEHHVRDCDETTVTFIHSHALLSSLSKALNCDPGCSAQDAASEGQVSPSWLQDCCISLSPATDMMALARNGKAVFLASRSPSSESIEFSIH